MKHIKKIMIMMMTGMVLCSGQPMAVYATAVTSENEQPALSDDNSLSSLSLSEGQISPSLQAGVTKYAATVPNDVTEVEVSARTTNAKAEITSISGNTNLSEGVNQISIVVTAENGSAATYKITVTRESLAASDAAGGELDDASAGDEADVVPISETSETKPVDTGVDSAEDLMDDGTPSEQYEALKEKYDSLHEKYEALKKTNQSKIYGLTGACIMLAAISLFLFFQRRREQENDDLFDEEDYDDGSYDKELYDDNDAEEDYDDEPEKLEDTEDYEEAEDYSKSEDYEVEEDYEESEVYEAKEDYEESEDDEDTEDYDASYDEEFAQEEPKTRKKERSSKKKHGRRESMEDELEVIDFNDL